MNLNIYNHDSLEQFCKNNNRISSYKNCVTLIKNAFCIDYNLYFRLNDGVYKQEFKKNRVYGTDIIEPLAKDNVDFTKIREYNKSLFISQVFYDNFLHFIIDLFIDYLFFIEIKQYIPNLKFCCHFKREFITRVKLWGLDKLFNLKSDMESDLYDGNYTDQHYSVLIFTYKDIMTTRKAFKFNIYLKHNTHMENLMTSYYNTDIPLKKYIYISRRKRDDKKTIADHNRSLVNENEFLSLVKNYGFEEVFLEDYDSILDKLFILKHAEIIIVQSSASCILLGMVNLKNVVIIGGPYRLVIFPKHHKNKVNNIKLIFSDDIKIKNQGANVPWELTQDNLKDLEIHIRSLQISS